MTYLFLFITGTILGSFVNFVSSRLINQQSLVAVRSSCASCGSKLHWYDLFPIFSFLLLRGKCRYCKAAIPAHFPLVELFLGILTVYIFTFSYGYSAFVVLLFFLAFLICAVTDLKTLYIHNLSLYPLLVIAVIGALYERVLLFNLPFAILSTLAIFLLSLSLKFILKKQTMGEGDYYVIFALTIYFGFINFIWIILYASLIGIAGAVLFKQKEVPFVPLLFAGTLIVYLFY